MSTMKPLRQTLFIKWGGGGMFDFEHSTPSPFFPFTEHVSGGGVRRRNSSCHMYRTVPLSDWHHLDDSPV